LPLKLHTKGGWKEERKVGRKEGGKERRNEEREVGRKEGR